jgi:hypothetical protein
MTRQNINIGSNPNDGQGDPLRVAFTKVNQNFTELYTNIGSSDFTLIDNNITTNTTNRDINISPNGSGNVNIGSLNPLHVKSTVDSVDTMTGAITVEGGVGIAGNLNVGGAVYGATAAFGTLEGTVIGAAMQDEGSFTTIYVGPQYANGHPKHGAAILPGLENSVDMDVAGIYDLGSQNRPFGNLYVDTVVSQYSGFLAIDNTPIGANIPDTGKFTTLAAGIITVDTITIANQFEANVGNLTVVSTSMLDGDVIVNGNLIINRSDNVSTALPGTAILPAVTDIYDLGSSANKMRNGYFSDNITAGGNIVATGHFIGDVIGGASSAVTAGTATYAATAGTTASAGVVTTNAQPFITSVGTLTGLAISGSLNAADAQLTDVQVTGLMSAAHRVKLNGGFQTDAANQGFQSGSYTVDLSANASSICSIIFNNDITFAYSTNIAFGQTVTVLAFNSDTANHVVTLPSAKNNKKTTTINVDTAVYATFTFRTVGIGDGVHSNVFCTISSD